MRKVLLSSALILSLAGGSAAFAAAKPMATTAPAAKTTVSAEAKAKTADCQKQWKAEKKHSQTRKAFMAACTKG